MWLIIHWPYSQLTLRKQQGWRRRSRSRRRRCRRQRSVIEYWIWTRNIFLFLDVKYLRVIQEMMKPKPMLNLPSLLRKKKRRPSRRKWVPSLQPYGTQLAELLPLLVHTVLAARRVMRVTIGSNNRTGCLVIWIWNHTIIRLVSTYSVHMM